MNNDDVPGDDEHVEGAKNNDEEHDPCQCDGSDFDHKVDDSDRDLSVILF